MKINVGRRAVSVVTSAVVLAGGVLSLGASSADAATVSPKLTARLVASTTASGVQT
jgi:hypothetical protein